MLGRYVDLALTDDMFGESTFERAERKMLLWAVEKSIQKAGLARGGVDAVLSGDLLNQIVSAGFAAREAGLPFLGIYSACSTMSEALLLGGVLVDGGYARHIAAATGSHFASAERQYRYPLELGTTRPPQSQWTVTGAGSAVLARGGEGPKLTCGTVGKVVDFGVSDVNNMGAAMAPAAADTILAHLRDTARPPDYYDIILTGDLGALGSRLLEELLFERGVDVAANHVDCGEVVYGAAEDEFQGGQRRWLQRGGAQFVHPRQDAPRAAAPRAVCGDGRAALHRHFGAGGDHPLHLSRRRHRGVGAAAVWMSRAAERGGKGGKDARQLSRHPHHVCQGVRRWAAPSAPSRRSSSTSQSSPRARSSSSSSWRGVVLEGLGLYRYLVDFAGAGATVPICGFGYLLARGAMRGAERGLFGAFTGALSAASAGVTAAVVFAFLAALFFRPKSKKN